MPEESKIEPAKRPAQAGVASSSWFFRNASFVRAICLILCYVSAMALLVGTLLIGAFTLLIAILLVILLASVAVIILLRLKMRSRS